MCYADYGQSIVTVVDLHCSHKYRLAFVSVNHFSGCGDEGVATGSVGVIFGKGSFDEVMEFGTFLLLLAVCLPYVLELIS